MSPPGVNSGWWLVVGKATAYLGAISWVVYNGCLGFLGGGRRHFTMQGRDAYRTPGKMPGNTSVFHDSIQTDRQTDECAHTKNKAATIQRLWSNRMIKEMTADDNAHTVFPIPSLKKQTPLMSTTFEDSKCMRTLTQLDICSS